MIRLKKFQISLAKFSSFFIVLMLSFSASYLLAAWSNPSSNPTGGNVEAPINTSGAAQVKTGGLSVGSLSAYGDSLVEDGSPTIEFSDTDNDDWWIHVNSDTMYFIHDVNDDGNWSGEGPWPLFLNNYGADIGNSLAVGSAAGISQYRLINAVGDISYNDGGIVGIYNVPRITQSATNHRTNYGILNVLDNDSISENGYHVDANALYSEVQIDGSSVLNDARAGLFVVDHNSSQTIDNGVGLYLDLQNSGSMTNYFGIYVGDVVEGTQGNAYAFWTNEGDVILDGDGNGSRGGTHAGSDLFFGEGQDAAIWYDGSNMRINPRVAGSGNLIVTSGSLYADSFIYTSDETLKQNIKTITDPLELVTSLRGVTFDWKEDGSSSYGFIAQELEEVLPELVKTSGDGTKAVEYGNIISILVEAIKEQQGQIDELTDRLEAIEN